jgi:hypothetical protein
MWGELASWSREGGAGGSKFVVAGGALVANVGLEVEASVGCARTTGEEEKRGRKRKGAGRGDTRFKGASGEEGTEGRGGLVGGTTWQGGGGVAWGASTAVGRQRPEAGRHGRCSWSGAPAADRGAPLTALGGAGRESGLLTRGPRLQR